MCESEGEQLENALHEVVEGSRPSPDRGAITLRRISHEVRFSEICSNRL